MRSLRPLIQTHWPKCVLTWPRFAAAKTRSTIISTTTPNRQGNDVGTQYRSVIFYETPQQQETAKQVIAAMANVWDAPIMTELSPLNAYYKAEDYHQNYFRQHPLQGYCAFVVAPKVATFRKVFVDKVKPL